MIKKALIKFFELYCRLVLSVYAPVKVYGKDKLPSKPFLIYSNHNSHLDYIILSLFSGKGFENTCVIAAKDYWFDNRIRNKFINVFFNGIPVNRRKLFRTESISEIVDNCKEKIAEKPLHRSLVIFPEGKRSADGSIQKFKIGPAAIASELNLEIVPAYIKGSFQAWPKGRLLMFPRKMELVFGDPFNLTAESIGKFDQIDYYKAVTETLEQTFNSLKKTFDASNVEASSS